MADPESGDRKSQDPSGVAANDSAGSSGSPHAKAGAKAGSGRLSRRLGLRLNGAARDRSGGMSRKGAAYEGAFEAIIAILVGLGLGYWADHYFGTDPIGLIVGVVVGFGAFVLRLLRLQRLLEDQEDDDEDGSTSGAG